jgi:peptidoglycan/LPS O-acetylase OafA/YrhL
MFIYTFPGRFFEFYAGIWLAKRVARSSPTDAGARKFPVWTLGGLAGIVAVVAALATIHYKTAHAYAYGLYHPAGVVLNNLVLPVFIAAFYWGLIQERSVLRWILSTRVADLLGRSSYAFYLIHTGQVLSLFIAVTVAAAGLIGPASAASAANLLGSVGVRFLYVTVLSIALYKGIEVPANRFIRRRFAAPREVPAAIPESAALPPSKQLT